MIDNLFYFANKTTIFIVKIHKIIVYLIILTNIRLFYYKLLVTSHTSLIPIPISMKINKFHAAYIANGPHNTPKNISVLKKYDPRIITTKPSKTIRQNQIQ